MFIPNSLRNTKINLQTLDQLDFELMQRNQDLETLQSFIIPLQQGFTSEREYKQPENTIKYLKLVYLMQMMLLYLEYTKQYQETTIDQLFKEEFKIESQIDESEKKLLQSKKVLLKLKHKQKSGKSELNQLKIDASKRETVYACLYCTGKAFLSIPLLDAHYQRHHIDKFEKPKQNFQETLLTVQTLLLQQQINSMINNQNQQDFMLQTMQQTQFMHQQAEESDSSDEEDLEEVAADDFQIRQLKLEFEQKNLMLQQQMEALQTFIQVHRPQEILDKIDQIENRIDNLKIPEPPKIEEKIPTPPPENYSFNAGPLEDEISELADDKDVYDAKDIQQEIKEEVTNDSGDGDGEKEASIIIDNQQEAAFLQEEKEFHHLVKSVRQKTVKLSREEVDHFRNIQLDNELEKKMKEVLTVNMNEIQFKSEKELEDYLMQLNGGISLSDRKSPGKKSVINDPETDEIKQVAKQDERERQQSYQLPGRLNKKSGKTIIEQGRGVRFQEPQTPSSNSNDSEEFDINQKITKKEDKPIPKTEPQIKSEKSIQSTPNLEPQNQFQQKVQKQEEIPVSKRKNSFEDSEENEPKQAQTIFQMRNPKKQTSLFQQKQPQELPLHENVIKFQQKSLIKKNLTNDSEEDF